MKRPGGFDGGDFSAAPPPPELPQLPVATGTPEAERVAPAEDAPQHLTESRDVATSPQRAPVAVPGSVMVSSHFATEQLELASADPVREASRWLRQAERQRRARERREQRRFTAHSRRRRRVWLSAAAAVAGLALFVAAGVFTPIMAVREIQVQGADRIASEDLETALARFAGVPLALVDEREVHRALEPFPLIQRYAIERIPPHTLLLRIEERDPVLAIARDASFGLVDAAGVLVADAVERPEGVPLASGTAIDLASPAFAAAARVVRDMPADLRVQLAAVSASSAQDVEFTLSSGTQVVWGEADETQRKALVLRAMLASLGAPSVIDVSAPDTPVFR